MVLTGSHLRFIMSEIKKKIFLFFMFLAISSTSYAFSNSSYNDYDKLIQSKLDKMVESNINISNLQEEMIIIFKQNQEIWFKIAEEMGKRNQLLSQNFKGDSSAGTNNSDSSYMKNLIAISKEQLKEQRKTMILLQNLLAKSDSQP